MAEDTAAQTAETQPAEAPAQSQPETQPLGDDHAQALLEDAVNRAESLNGGESHPWDDPDTARSEIEKLRKEAGAARVNAKKNAAEEARNEFAQTIGKALGLIKEDEPVDPAVLTQQVEQSNALALQAQVENAVMRASMRNDANALALLDSVSFLEKAAQLDPKDTAGFDAAVQSAVEANPLFGKSPAPQGMKPNPAQGRSASPPLGIDEQIAQAAQNGDMRAVMRLKAKQSLGENTHL